MVFPFEGFFKACDTAYHAVASSMPQFVQDRPVATAFTLGAGAAYGTVYCIEKLLKGFLPYYNAEKYLPMLEKAGMLFMFGVPFVYSIVDPDGAKQLLEQHPVYTSGLLGLVAGSTGRAAQDLHQSKGLEKRLEN